MNGLKIGLVAGLGALLIAGCETLPSVGGGAGDSNFASGSALDYRLGGGDREALGQAALAAIESGQTRVWRGRRASGVVEPASYSLANLMENPKARIASARGDLDLAHMMETDLGLYVSTRNSNVRTGPGTDNKVAEMLPSGAGVEVVGRVTDKSWMLVAVDGVIRGYVFQDLLIKAPGTELELAGGPRRRPLLCREFAQRIEVGAERDEWEGAACNDGTGWRVAPPEVDPEQQPENLLEF